MTYWGMNPTELYGAGGNITNLEPDAGRATGALQTSLEEAAGAVHHPHLAGKIRTFATDQATVGNRLRHNVGAAGSQVQNAAVQGDQGDEETVADQAPAAGLVSDLAPVVTKSINYVV